MRWLLSLTVALVTAGTASAGSLADIKHVVLFMQENRAFDHVSWSQNVTVKLISKLSLVFWNNGWCERVF
jgi:hypothetical protein